MFEDFSFFPRAASTVAGKVDALYLFMIAMSAFFIVLIFTAILVLSIRYRRRKGHTAEQIHGSVSLEMLWSAIPLLLVLFIFGWSARLYFQIVTPPSDAMEIYVTGKQWMWKAQHPTGQREINALHVPVGEPIVLTMTSEDVIHDFFIPAFRVKADVIPGRYTQMWFEATEIGEYHLFCAEYCGTKHSEMVGTVKVMDPADYEIWLSGQPAVASPVEAGKVLFENQRCDTCHAAGSGQRGPNLVGRFGNYVETQDGQTLLFDEDYVRESILEPRARISRGYEPLMPSYAGQISEEQVLYLVSYIKSLTTETSGGDEE